RLLAAEGVFVSEGDRFRHSEASRMLRTDHPQSMCSFARMFGLDTNWRIFEHLEHSLRTGTPATPKVLPDGFFARFAAHPEEARVFDEAMVAKAQAHIAAIVRSYDFSRFSTIGDIGGGQGHLLQGVLRSAPDARGVLFDLPHVVETRAGIASERLRLQGGDFFKGALPACDGYLIMEVIHDWPDEESVAILRAIRRAAPKHAKVLMIESIVPPGPQPDWTKTLDIVMLVLVGGRQRTRDEYAALLEAAGLALEREIDTGAGITILEAGVR
ncbi:MAG TPA: methyltransferase, partial [Vicinamibacteria bacterium]|nr:methyltransferase [Vicinamibacteria bacterium]